MSWMMNDLICNDCGHQEYEAMYKRADGPDDCPDCEKVMSVDLRGMRFAVHGHGPGSFAAMDMGDLGYCDTKEKYDHAVAQIQKQYPGQEVRVDVESKVDKKRRLDELRHRAHQQRLSHGIDTAQSKKLRAEQKRIGAKLRAEGKTKGRIPSIKEIHTGKPT